jgi:hypothetical protein
MIRFAVSPGINIEQLNARSTYIGTDLESLNPKILREDAAGFVNRNAVRLLSARHQCYADNKEIGAWLNNISKKGDLGAATGSEVIISLSPAPS